MPTFNPNDPYRPLFGSLADRKSVDLAQKYADKKQNLDPTPTPAAYELDFEDTSSGSSNLIDVGQASLARAGGNLADVGRSISNRLFDTDFDATEATGWSDPTTADIAAGVSPELRAELQAEQHQVLTDVAEGDYGSALISALKAAPGVAAESFATIPEVAVGAALTAATGGLAGPAVFGKKIKDIGETAEKIKKGYDKAKDLKEANRLGKLVSSAKNLPAATAKAAGRASILTADLTQQQIQEYRAKYGEDPSVERGAAMTLGVLATTIWEPAIIANLFIPKFRQELIQEGQNLVKNLGKGSNLKSIGDRIGNAFKKIGKAGAAEAGQEYIQTWQEILAVHITPEQANDVWAAAASKLDEKTLQDQALTGGILGGFAGGVTRAAITAPTVAVGTAADIAKGTAKVTAKTVGKVVEAGGKAAQKSAVKAADKVLSPEEREAVRGDYETRKAVVEDKIADMEVKAKDIEGATTYSDITGDSDLKKAAEEAQVQLNMTDDDLANPKNLKKLKDKMVRNNRAAQAKLDLELKGSTVAKVATRVGKNIKTGVVEAAEAVLDSEQVEQVIKTAKAVKGVAGKAVKDSVQAVKEVRSSAALGLIEMGIQGGEAVTDDLVKGARDLNLSELQKVATAVTPSNAKAGKILRSMAARKKQLLSKVGQRSDDLITKENLSPVIADIASKGKIESKNAIGAAAEIRSTLAGRINDSDTLSKVKTALEVYEGSTAYTQQERGSINKANMKVLKERVANAERRLGRAPTAENIGKAVDAAVTAMGKGAKKVRKETFKASVKAQRAYKNVKESETVQETVKRVQTAMESLDETAEDYADQLDTLLAEKFGEQPAEVIPDGALKAKLEKVEELIEKRPQDVADVITNLDKMAAAIKKAGVKSADDLIKQFPKLGQHPEFYAKLQTYFESEAKPKSKSSVVMNENDQINEEEDVLIDDNKLVSMFKKITGCKS